MEKSVDNPEQHKKRAAKGERKQPAVVICLDSDSEPEPEHTQSDQGIGRKRAAAKNITAAKKKKKRIGGSRLMNELADFNASPVSTSGKTSQDDLESCDGTEPCNTEEDKPEAPQPDMLPSLVANKNNLTLTSDEEEKYQPPDEEPSSVAKAGVGVPTERQMVTPEAVPSATPDAIPPATPEAVPSASASSEAQVVTPEIKKEMTQKEVKNKRVSVYEKYKDRFLLDRPLGIGRLGGGHIHTYPKPTLWNPNIWDPVSRKLKRDYPFPKHLSELDLIDGRPLDMDAFQYMAYNELWNIDAPKFAGQPFAAVTGVAEDFVRSGHPFPVFIRRSRSTKRLGWEYVGNYKVVTPGDEEDTDIFYESAENYSPVNRAYIARKLLNSAKSECGYGSKILGRWRTTLTQELAKDNSPAAPAYMIEGREPTSGEKHKKRPSLAARARALRFSSQMTDEKFVEVLVQLDEYYEQRTIEFVGYDERIYNWCVSGKTSHDANGDLVKKTRREPARAGDWYDWAEQKMLML